MRLMRKEDISGIRNLVIFVLKLLTLILYDTPYCCFTTLPAEAGMLICFLVDSIHAQLCLSDKH